MTAGPGGGMMAAEMADQPQVLRALLDRRRTRPLAPLGVLPAPRGVVLIARGSSDHAATYGRYLLEAVIGVPVSLCAPSLWTRYKRRPQLDGLLAIGMSQSGRTPEIAEALAVAGRAGAATLAITNDGESPLARAADLVLTLEAGPERAVPATKSFLAQLIALVIVAEQLGDAPWSATDPDRIPAAVAELLDDRARVEPVVAALADARALVLVGAGYLYAVAMEGALKLIETASVPVLAYSAAQLLHGPIAVAGSDVPVICLSTPGPLERDVRRVADTAAARGATVVWIGDGAPPAATRRVCVPAALPEALMPALHAVRMQQLALALSRALGADADAPPGLAKVTIT